MLKSKRGIAIDEAVPLIVLIVVAVFSMFFFRTCEAEKSYSKANSILFEKKLNNAHEVLMGYLTIMDDNGNKVDFIAKSYLDDDIELLKIDIEQYFRDKFSYFTGWRIELIDSSGKPVSVSDGGAYDESSTRYLAAYFVIPLGNGDHIFIKLYLGEGIRDSQIVK